MVSQIRRVLEAGQAVSANSTSVSSQQISRFFNSPPSAPST